MKISTICSQDLTGSKRLSISYAGKEILSLGVNREIESSQSLAEVLAEIHEMLTSKDIPDPELH